MEYSRCDRLRGTRGPQVQDTIEQLTELELTHTFVILAIILLSLN